MRKINWGIIGLGNIANIFANAFNNIDSASIKAVASKNVNNLKFYKKKFQLKDKFCFDNYFDLIKCPEIDIIYIALPNSYHSELVIEALKNKKNILVEKPAFINVKDLEIVKELIWTNKIYFTEGFMYRHLPYFLKVKEILKSNLLGKVIGLESNFNSKIYKQINVLGLKIRKPDLNSRLFNKDLGGGVIFDLGCYPLSFSTFVNLNTYNVQFEDIKLKKVKKIYCESGTEIFSNIEINFNNKFLSKITCSFKDKFNQSTIINFEHGKLIIKDTWTPKKNMTLKLYNRNNKSDINFHNNDNIYSYQIKNISNQLLQEKTEPIFPSITMDEIETNTKLLNEWVSLK